MEEIVNTSNRGNLIVILGPSGAGKDTIIDGVLKINKNAWFSVSATTRSMRGNEQNGVEHIFLKQEEFEEKIKQGYFLEYAEYNNYYYGTPKEQVNKKLNEGYDVLLILELQGALKIKELVKDAIFIFILPPSMEELKRRLINRKTEDKEKILKRFKITYNQIKEVAKYNYVVINDKLDEAIEKVNAILISERCKTSRIERINIENEDKILNEIMMEE